MEMNKVYLGNSLEVIKTFPDESVDCVVTSPPYYGLRDYGTGTWVGGDPNCNHEAARKKTRFDYAIDEKQASSKGTDMKCYSNVCPVCGAVRKDEQIGLEETPEAYIERLVSLFREIRRVLKKEGTCWVNLGDSYNSSPSGNSAENIETHRDSISYKKVKKGEDRSQQRKAGLVKGLKPKDLIGIPWMFAFAMRADGWYLRQDIIWHKPNPMPEAVTDRCTKSHEYIFLFSKSQKYFFDYEAIQEEAVTQADPRIGKRVEYDGMRKGQEGTGNRAFVALKTKPKTKNCQYDGQRPNTMHLRREQGLPDEEYVVRNKRDVWSVNVRPNNEAHFATYPQMLIQPCILAGSPQGGVVLDPFMGSGTTGIVARKLGRKYVGIELNPEYQKMAERRIANLGEDLFSDVED